MSSRVSFLIVLFLFLCPVCFSLLSLSYVGQRYLSSLGLTVYEIATRTELPGDGEDWHAMRDGRASALAPSRSQDLSKVLRQVSVFCLFFVLELDKFCRT